MAYRWAVAALGAALWLGGGTAAHASSPTTCSRPNEGTTVHVLVDGRATTIDVSLAGILVNGMFCGFPDEVNSIFVEGGSLSDRVTLSGDFIPGAGYESDWDELEVGLWLGGGDDSVTLHRNDKSEGRLEIGTDIYSEFLDTQLYLNSDNDPDMSLRDVETFRLYAHGGDDYITAQSHFGSGAVIIYAGSGNDIVRGSRSADRIYAEGGDDQVMAGARDDVIYDGPGADQIFGEDGNDRFVMEAAPDAGDDLRGGPGVDTVDYSQRTAPIDVTIGNAVADDGEAGEQDEVADDVEAVTGGRGSDVLIGSDLYNILQGGPGNDLLDGRGGSDIMSGGGGVDTVDYSSRTGDVYVTIGNGLPDDGEADDQDEIDGTVENVTGGAGNDTLIGNAARNTLRGGPGNDSLEGEDGNDTLYGDAGDDAALGGLGADKLYGGVDSDLLDGGADADTYSAGGGNDFLYNDDGVAETVNCGGGTDDAEVDTGATDTFIGCEL